MNHLTLLRAASTLTGSVGLASALAYLAAAAMILLGVGGDDGPWRQAFLRVAVPLMLLPYVLLILHLYLRTQLGVAYLRAGHLDEALRYTEGRLTPSFARSRREALHHLIVRARAQLAAGEYEASAATAAAPLSAGGRRPSTAQLLELTAVALEALLRAEDLVAARELLERHRQRLRNTPGHAARRAHVRACAAELHQRAGDHDACAHQLEEAGWLNTDLPRLALSRALAAWRFGRQPSDWRAALELLDAHRDRLERQIPGRAAELHAIAASLALRLGDHQGARRRLQLALDDPRADDRARHLRGQIAAEVGAADPHDAEDP